MPGEAGRSCPADPAGPAPSTATDSASAERQPARRMFFVCAGLSRPANRGAMTRPFFQPHIMALCYNEKNRSRIKPTPSLGRLYGERRLAQCDVQGTVLVQRTEFPAFPAESHGNLSAYGRKDAKRDGYKWQSNRN